MALNESKFQDIVRAILAVSKPAAIILFGSYARGDAHQFSDVDVLVIREEEFRSGESRRKELGALYRAISKNCDVPKDVILFTQTEFRAWRQTTNHMAAAAYREGRILHGQV